MSRLGKQMKSRSRQIDRAEKLVKQCEGNRFPRYDAKKNVWHYGRGKDRREDVYLDSLLQDFACFEMRFRYTWNRETVTRRVFAEVLEDMIARYETLSIEGFEEDYNKQQIEWLGIIRKQLKRCYQKGQSGEKVPHYCKIGRFETRGDIEHLMEELTCFCEVYDFKISENEKVKNSWHEHFYQDVLNRLIQFPEHFSVELFEEQYSRQQLELIRAVREKLLDMGKKNNC